MIRVVFNRKGGVGKSTIVCNLAAVAARRGQRTLVVDLDAQANATQYLLGADAAEPGPGSAQFFEQTLSFSVLAKSLDTFIRETPFPSLWLMPAAPELGELISKLEARHKIYKLREALRAASGQFDEIWIDTPPALNIYTISALIAAERCLIPFDCDDFSRQALYQLMENVAEIRADHNPELTVEGIVVNQFQSRSNLPQRMVDELKAEGLPVLDSHLASSIKIKESHEASAPLPWFAPSHRLSRQFSALYDLLQPQAKARGKRQRAAGAD